jgi:hypothetical protein
MSPKPPGERLAGQRQTTKPVTAKLGGVVIDDRVTRFLPAHRSLVISEERSTEQMHIVHGKNGKTRKGEAAVIARRSFDRRSSSRSSTEHVRFVQQASRSQSATSDRLAKSSFFRVFPFLPWTVFFPPANSEWPIAEFDVVRFSE